MRHRKAYRKLGRKTEHRLAMLRNLAGNLLTHGRVKTTVQKAKEVRKLVEKLITVAKEGLSDPERKGVFARRYVMRYLYEKRVMRKLFNEIAPACMNKNGGYTRIIKLGFRKGDGAEMAIIELVDWQPRPKKKEKKETAGEK